jgi:hypothetical protein
MKKMKDKIQIVFDRIHAEDSLKAETKKRVNQLTNGYRRQSNRKIKPLAAAIACVFVLFIGISGYYFYVTPVAAISIDINPSLELEVNRFDRVIHVQGYNTDGVQLASELELENMNYSDAINRIMENDMVVSCLQIDPSVEVTLTSGSEKRMQNMQECISAQTNLSSEDIYCSGNLEEVTEAHEAEMSFGKYRAFLELQELNPDITVEDVRNLTMREIRNMIEAESSGNEEPHLNSNGQGNGMQNGYRHGK